MAEFGSFEYGTGIVYGPGSATTAVVQALEFLHTDQIRIVFTEEIVVNPTLLDPETYALQDSVGNPVAVVSVRAPHSDLVTEIIVHTNTLTVGTTYTLSVAPLQTRDGSTLGGTAEDGLYLTKATNMFNAVPDVFDLRPNSPLRVFFEAVSISDDLIGGARSRLL